MIHKTLPSAIFSDDRMYRYMLTRQWDNSKPYVVFVGLNPSTADENLDDPTIRRCIGYAKAWGCGGIIMVNLFAFRATDPKDMRKAEDPIGPENDRYLKEAAKHVHTVVAAWGNHGRFMGRDSVVKSLFSEAEFLGYIHLTCLELSKDGNPKHPLYLKKDLIPRCF